MKKWIFLAIWILILILSNVFNINDLCHLPKLFAEGWTGIILIIIYFGTNPPSDNGDYEYFLKL